MEINGVRVVDANRPITIEIKDTDVKKGSNKNPAACAVALACKRTFHGADARVHIGRTYIKLGNKWMRFGTPKSLRTEIIAFDRGGTFAPGKYVLSPMDKGNRLGKHKPTGPKKAKARIARITHHVVADVRHGLIR